MIIKGKALEKISENKVDDKLLYWNNETTECGDIASISSYDNNNSCYITAAAPLTTWDLSFTVGDNIVKIKPDGNVEYDQLTASQAAKVFWEAVSQFSPTRQLVLENEQLKKRITELENKVNTTKPVDYKNYPIEFIEKLNLSHDGLYPWQQEILKTFQLDKELLCSDNVSGSQLINDNGVPKWNIDPFHVKSKPELTAIPFTCDVPGVQIGDCWLDVDNNITYIFDGNMWVECNEVPQPSEEDLLQKRIKAYNEAMKILG